MWAHKQPIILSICDFFLIEHHLSRLGTSPHVKEKSFINTKNRYFFIETDKKNCTDCDTFKATWLLIITYFFRPIGLLEETTYTYKNRNNRFTYWVVGNQEREEGEMPQ